MIASARRNEKVKLWNSTRGLLLTELETNPALFAQFCFSPDSHYLFTMQMVPAFPVMPPYNFVSLWNVPDGTLVRDMGRSFTNGATTAVFSPDGKRIAAGGGERLGSPENNGRVRIWDTESGTTLSDPTLGNSFSYVRTLAFSPDGKLLASGHQDGKIYLWRMSGGKFFTLDGHTAPVNAVVFTPDGQNLISGGADNTIRVWDTATGQPKTAFAVSSASILGLAIEPSGQILISAGADHTIKLWDIPTKALLFSTTPAQTFSVSSISLASDGKTLVSGHLDGSIKVWQLEGN